MNRPLKIANATALLLLLQLLLLLGKKEVAYGQLNSADYIDSAPSTVYEAATPEDMNPQNMDYDQENNMFVAHAGWYNDMLIHYYKFRMYTPSTYDGVIAMDSSSADVPIQNVYIVSTDGTFDGAVGDPIIEYHTADGNDYSDFMKVVFVAPPSDAAGGGYIPNDIRSVQDVTDFGGEQTETDIVLNMPVVPTDATLQDPVTMGTNKAPIEPTPVWYKGVEVWTYVFEVTDEAAATYFAGTRTTDDEGYAITVTPFATSNSVNAISLWHVNQYTNGVVEGVNGGGPSPAGMRNVINLDRGDDG